MQTRWNGKWSGVNFFRETTVFAVNEKSASRIGVITCVNYFLRRMLSIIGKSFQCNSNTLKNIDDFNILSMKERDLYGNTLPGI